MTTLAKILKALTGSAPRASADLRADLQAIDLAALENAVDKLEADRRQLLLRGTDAELQQNAAAITAANLECERAAAAVEELKKQIADAEAREAKEAIETAAAAAQQEKAKLVSTTTEIEATTTKLKALLRDADTSSDALSRWNRRIEKTDPSRRIEFTPSVTVKQRAMKVFQ